MTYRARGLVEVSVRAYRTLLWLYPRPFRRRFADEMAHVFWQMGQEAWRRRGVAGLSGVWLRVIVDLLRTACVEHLDEIRRKQTVSRIFRDRAYLLPALAVAMTVAAVVTPADPASMLLVGIPLYGVHLCAFASRRLPPSGRLLAVAAGTLNLLFIVGTYAILSYLAGAGYLRPPAAADHGVWPVLAILLIPPSTTALTVGSVWAAARLCSEPPRSSNCR